MAEKDTSVDEGLKTITFGRKELDPSDEAAYREKIAKAKQGGLSALKGSTPLGHVERPQMPSLAPATVSTPSGLTEEGGVAPRPPGSPVIRPETQQQLLAMQEAQKKLAEEEQSKKPEEKKDEATEDLLEMFDFAGQNEAERILNNKKRRREIEGRCSEMSFEDLIMRDEVQQIVPIRDDGKFTVIFRSLTPEESLFIKQYMAKEQSPNEGYMLEKYSLCQLCCSLISINGKAFVDHRDSDGSPDEVLFKKKLNQLMKKSGYIIADLGVNYMWFDLRVRKLIAPEKLGNG